LALAKGAFIARQDHDDLSRPERLQKQVSFLIENPEIFLVGTCAAIHNPQGFTGRYHDHPTNSKRLSLEILFDNPFVHSSIMFRREVIKSVGYYQPLKEITPLDDYDFISRVASKFKVANLSEYLVEYYEGENTLTSELRFAGSSKKNALKEKQAYIMARNMAGIIGPKDLDIVAKGDRAIDSGSCGRKAIKGLFEQDLLGLAPCLMGGHVDHRSKGEFLLNPAVGEFDDPRLGTRRPH
jgi:hypothetical protein